MAEGSQVKYEVVEGWDKLSAEYSRRDVCGVAVDSQDRVHIITRGDSRVIVYDRDGNFIRTWGENAFPGRPHGITIGPDDAVYTVDDGEHTVRKWTPDGKELLMTLGTPGQP